MGRRGVGIASSRNCASSTARRRAPPAWPPRKRTSPSSTPPGYHLSHPFCETFTHSHPKGRPLHDPNRSHAGEASASGKKGGPLYITVGPGERPSDFLTGEEKGKYWFACEHSSGACARRKGLAREMGVLKRNMKGVK